MKWLQNMCEAFLNSASVCARLMKCNILTVICTAFLFKSGNKQIPNVLQEATGIILTNSACSGTYWGSNINAGHICIHDADTGSCNVCQLIKIKT